MKNGLYLTEKDSVTFNDWFVEVYLANHPKEENKVTCKNVTIVITEDCNFACTYCYMHHKTPKRMDHSTARDVVDFLLNQNLLNGYVTCKESPCVILDFIGGEPLLEIDTIDYFMDYFIYKAFQSNHPWANNYVISMSSNGSLYPEEELAEYRTNKEGYLEFTCFSLLLRNTFFEYREKNGFAFKPSPVINNEEAWKKWRGY